MAWMWRAICNRCDARFDAGWGHTRRAYCLKCAACGQPRSVLKEEVEGPPGSDFDLSQVAAEVEANPEQVRRSIEEALEELAPNGFSAVIR